VLTATGIEGSLVYAFSRALREAIARDGCATLHLDLLPQTAIAQVQAQLARGQGSKSLSSFLQSQFRLRAAEGRAAARVRRARAPGRVAQGPAGHAGRATADRRGHQQRRRPALRRRSTRTGMLLAVPGPLLRCGEMLDWEAPTGGYLLSASLASGRRAGQGASRWLGRA
jgi:predicted flavoprotein YhiN